MTCPHCEKHAAIAKLQQALAEEYRLKVIELTEQLVRFTTDKPKGHGNTKPHPDEGCWPPG